MFNKRSRRRIMLLAALVTMLVIAVPVMAAPHGNSLNARAIRWQETDSAIHLLPFPDNGRPGQPPAVLKEGETAILLFEWPDLTIENLFVRYIDNPNHTITLSIDDGPAFSVKDGYQKPHIAETLSGPRWKWDHDGDGPGDGDGDGIDDWAGPTLFWRYPVSGLSVGDHTLILDVVTDTLTFTDTISITVVP